MIVERENNKIVTNKKFIFVVLRANYIILPVVYKTVEHDSTHDDV